MKPGGRKGEDEAESLEGNFFAKKFPSTPPFKKLLNGADRSCASIENGGAAKLTGPF
jgi:hypothetical protein